MSDRGGHSVHLLRAASLACEGHDEEPTGPDAREVHDLRRFARRSFPTLPSLPTRRVRVLVLGPGLAGRLRGLPPRNAPAGRGGHHGRHGDLLLATVHLALDRWNGASSGAIAVMMPISPRPAEWREDVVGNLSLMAQFASTAVAAAPTG